jgi:Double zinc ribbon
VKCASCGCDNREGAKFCGECAAPLAEALGCPKCGTANPKGRRFCDSCGHRIAEAVNLPAPPDPRAYPPKHLVEKILTTCSALEGEGKQVIVLVAEREGIVVRYDVRQKPPRIGLKKAQRFLDPPDVA